MPRYRPVDSRVDFPALEGRILEFWRKARIFEKSLESRRGAPEWVFYEGPPTANGKPGIHHVVSRTFKDVFPRYRAMTGHYVHRKAGWDCHGLPVELEIEKEIGTQTKRDIEEFGIREFNARCRESVTRYVKDWERLTERIGFWLDLSEAYWTMTPDYIESVWWSLKRLHELGLLFEDDRSAAYCPRCGTGLSDHEVALGYTTVTDPSVTVRFPVTSGPLAERGASILAWTTTPYTLTANVALAVHPEITYAVVRSNGEPLVVAEALAPKLFGDDVVIEERLPANDLAGLSYEPPFDFIGGDGNAHIVVTGDFVTTAEGTGVVHIAPAFGQDDLDTGRRFGLAMVNPMDERGRLTDLAGPYTGMPVKEADPHITRDLEGSGKLWASSPYEHTYPLCWRCDTPLIYWARQSWYVGTRERKQQLLDANEDVGWYPEHIKHGRYGDWLRNNVDWALSRERFWGTPLPIWRCENRHDTVVGSLTELSDLAGRDVTRVDPHRPDIDEVMLSCPECGADARRVPEVIDAWYDSGAMPFAQWGYHPDLGRGAAEFERRFPADFICEAVDQTRGWFYSLMAEGVLLFDQSAYRNCVVLGLIVDKDGRKMSTRVGNALDPWTVLDRYGADALRWFLVAAGSPWTERRVYPEAVEDVVRRFLLTLWNTYAFFVTYANLDDADPGGPAVPLADRPPIDRWALSRLHGVVAHVRDALESYDATGAAREIDTFVDDLSNWYVRRSRRRFWDPARTTDAATKGAAYQTLYECLATLAGLLAPFTPFVAEEIYGNLAPAGSPESVHLSDYPSPDDAHRDPELEAAMDVSRKLVTLGRAARTQAGARVRQPLARALIHVPGDPRRLDPLIDLIAEELNVRTVQFAETAGELTTVRVRPNFRVLGPRLGARAQEVGRVLADDDGRLAADLAAGRSVMVPLGSGEAVELAPDDVEVLHEPGASWGVAAEGGLTVALDVEISPELKREGLAREIVHAVQGARKTAGLAVADRIELSIDAEGEAAEAVKEHRDLISAEVLATQLALGLASLDDGTVVHTDRIDLDGVNVGIAIRKVASFSGS
ncbi:MAG: isoleucine--tRNA ligase [Actinomycetota bacterium]